MKDELMFDEYYERPLTDDEICEMYREWYLLIQLEKEIPEGDSLYW